MLRFVDGNNRGKLPLFGLIVLSSLIHLFSIWIYTKGYDLEMWVVVGRALASGKAFYCEALASGYFFGYPPFFAQTILYPLALAIPPSDRFAFLLALRLVFLAFDIGTGILLWEMLGSKRLLSALWFLNPLAIGVAQCQFDGIPAFFILLAVYALRRSATMSSWLLGIATSLKIYPGLLLPVSIGRAKSLRGVAIASLAAVSVPLLSVTPYLKSDCFWRTMLVHVSSDPLTNAMREYALPAAYAALLPLTFAKKLSPVRSGILILSSFNFLFHLSTGPSNMYLFSVQHLVSLLPLLILDMPEPRLHSEKILAYNAIWASASAVRYRVTLYRHFPMPIPFEVFSALSFYGVMVSLVAACAIALLEEIRPKHGDPAPP